MKPRKPRVEHRSLATSGSLASFRTVTGPDYTLIHGDCLDVLAVMADKSVSHVITDPPYDAATHTNQRVGSTRAHKGIAASPCRAITLGFDPITDEQRNGVATNAARIARRWSMMFCASEQIGDWKESILAAGLDFVRTGAWVKPGSTPQFSGDRPAVGFEAIAIAHAKGRKKWNGGGRHGLWTFPIIKPQTGVRLHTTQKPLELMEALVADFTDPGDIVLDPFMGSGTTGMACIRLGRTFIGIERDADYFEIACRRLAGDEAKPRKEQPSLFDAITPPQPEAP